MNIAAIKEIAKKHGIKTSKLKKADLVRAIQESEGNPTCFCTSFSDQCGQENCMWRADCD